MVGEALAGLGAIKTAFDMAKALKDINDATIRQGAAIELQQQILTAQAEQSALLDEIRALKEIVASFETWATEKKRYELKQLGEAGTTAYMLKKAERGSEPPHWVCTNCYGNRRISIFQMTTEIEYRRRVHECPACKNRVKPTIEPAWMD